MKLRHLNFFIPIESVKNLSDLSVRLVSFLITVLVAGPALSDNICEGVQCGAKNNACIVSNSGLPLRLLVKPDANIFAEANAEAKVLRGNVAPFSVLYGYEMMGCEKSDVNNFSSNVWYRVGYTESESFGFMSANDVVQWRSAMTVAYTNPGASERERVLMFEDFTALESLLTGIVEEDRKVKKVYASIANDELEKLPDGLIAIEQEIWTDIDRNFYLMPILEFEDLNDFYPEGDFRALKIAALTKQSGASRRKACNLSAEDAKECLARNKQARSVNAIDLVWVIDLTLSMQPYIDAVADAVKKSSSIFGDEDAIRFGLVGYRDDVEQAPWLEFVSRNFTPELLSRTEFMSLMEEGQVKAAKKSTGDFPEEVFVGVQDGIRSAWREDSARVIVLIGDASSHTLGHQKNVRNLSLEAVKELAGQERVYIAAILLANPESISDSKIAEIQFARLSSIGGTRAFAKVPVSKADNGRVKLQTALRNITSDITQLVATGDLSIIASRESKKVEGGATKDEIREAIKRAIRAAVVDYMGKDAEVPAGVTAWVADRDFANLKKRSFNVRVVMTRKDIEELKVLIESLLAAVRAGSKSSSGFISDTTGASASAAIDMQIANSEEFAKSKLVPRWIKSLPYQSRALSYSIEAFLQLPADDRTAFEKRLENLVNTYEQILSNTDAWHHLNDRDTEESQVYMLSLNRLP